jgi:hypothetical protein
MAEPNTLRLFRIHGADTIDSVARQATRPIQNGKSNTIIAQQTRTDAQTICIKFCKVLPVRKQSLFIFFASTEEDKEAYE